MDQALKDWAISIFIRLAGIYSPSGSEGELAAEIAKILQDEIAIPSSVSHDNAHYHFPEHGLEGKCGNFFVTINPSGNELRNLPCIGFNAHLDGVEPGKGIKAQLNAEKTRIISAGDTILRADDTAGIVTILTMLKALQDQKIPHGPLQLIFTVSEETKLLGSRYIDPEMIKAKTIFAFDGRDPAELLLGACSSDKFNITIKGKNAHAGGHPDDGISASLIASLAIATLKSLGTWGRINDRHGEHAASVNFNIVDHEKVGTNSVQGWIKLAGEARAFNPEYLDNLTNSIRQIFEQAAQSVENKDGLTGAITEFKVDHAYDSFQLTEKDDVVKRAVNALMDNGLTPVLRQRIMGGLDACWLNTHAPTATLGSGTHNYHTIDEYLDLEEFYTSVDIAINLARAK